jgi:hypothetical protein
MCEIEIWKDIQSYEDYQISNLGRVKSLRRKGVRIAKTLILFLNHNKYLCANLYKNKKSKQIKIHRLVAQAFILNFENKSQINHKDGNKTNNIVENLEWVTPKENMQHADVVLDVNFRGRNNGQAKLIEEQIYEIRNLLKMKLSQRKIAGRYNVAYSTIGRIFRNENWRCLE